MTQSSWKTSVIVLAAICACHLPNGGRKLLADDSRPRLLVLTDIGGDPDDQQSLVRLLVHANEFDIEGLIASSCGTLGELKDHVTKPQLIRQQIDAYARVLPNLSKHADGFPTAEHLMSVVKS